MSNNAKRQSFWKRKQHRSPQNDSGQAPDDIVLDTEYYRSRYPDLHELDEQTLHEHWKRFGYNEGRFASAEYEKQLAPHQASISSELTSENASLKAASLVNLQGGTPASIAQNSETPEADIEEASIEIEAHTSLHRLDIDYYRGRYPDLAELSDVALKEHWVLHGEQEGRFPSYADELAFKEKQAEEAAELAAKQKAESATRKSQSWLDLEFYLAAYPDLEAHGITSQEDAESHYKSNGESEGRAYSFRHWLKRQKIPDSLLPDKFDREDIQAHCAERGIEVDTPTILNTLQGEHVACLPLTDNDQETHRLYVSLAQHYLEQSKQPQAKALLEVSLDFEKSARALELLGNCYIEFHPEIALYYYDMALALADSSKWVAHCKSQALAKLARYDDALDTLLQGLARYPDFRPYYNQLEHLAEQKWGAIQAELLAYVDAQDRHTLVTQASRYAVRLYNAYLVMFGKPLYLSDTVGQKDIPALAPLPPLGQINQQRVLIIADFNVPQCVRYRIDQKVEQLVKAGIEVTTLDWQKLPKDNNANLVALHDVVIFYRVPAVPSIIKAIAQVNAAGKLSLYEIDDLIFEAVYPPDIQSYGGYVSQDTYRGLTRGMALFNATARLCRMGIASTDPLRQCLAPLVQSSHCLLHRNGLDSLNQFRVTDKSKKQTIDIFYGSGTQAHNSDFIEQALPAIERVLDEHSNARLVVVGYLRLPKAFRERFAEQFSQLPAVKSVQGYWSLLEQADINIAVLHDDSINACKSELKWFEAACFNIPSVVSSTANYRDVIKDGEDGFLATTEEEWYSAIKQLVVSDELRHQVGESAMQRTKEAYSLEVLGQSLLDQLGTAIEQTAPQQPSGKPKVALVNVFFPPQSIGGATRVVADNFAALRKHYSEQLDVCIFTADAECIQPHQLSVYDYQGCRVYRTSTLWREHMDWHPEDPEMYSLFSEFLELEKPDVIHFHCVQRLSSTVLEAARDAGIPYMVTAHDAWWISDFQFLVDHKGKVYPEGHPDPFAPITLPKNITLADSIERRRNLKDLLHSAARVLTVSQAFADIYRKNGITEIEVIPNGISDELPWAPKDTSHTQNVVCGHIGGMAEHKGYYLLKDAVMETQPKNMEFLIADHAKEEGYVQHTYWGDVPVTFIGRVSQDRIVDLYRQIDVLFAPSLWPESFGLVTREAAACGCWVVASNLGGIGEDVIEGETGHVIEPTEDALTELLEKMQGNAQKYKQCIESTEYVPALKQTEKLQQEYLNVCQISSLE